MIKKLFVAIAMLMCVGAAWAAKKCVKISSAVSYTAIEKQSDWSVVFADGNGAIGIAMCVVTRPTVANEFRDYIEPGYGFVCWCRMLSPVVSKWRHGYTDGDTDCYEECPNFCATGGRLSGVSASWIQGYLNGV